MTILDAVILMAVVATLTAMGMSLKKAAHTYTESHVFAARESKMPSLQKELPDLDPESTRLLIREIIMGIVALVVVGFSMYALTFVKDPPNGIFVALVAVFGFYFNKLTTTAK